MKYMIHIYTVGRNGSIVDHKWHSFKIKENAEKKLTEIYIELYKRVRPTTERYIITNDIDEYIQILKL